MRYADFFRALQSGQVDYVLVGGFAVALQGRLRATQDVDIALAMNRENLLRFLEVAKALELQPALPVPLETLLDEAAIERYHHEKGMLVFSCRQTTPMGLVVDILVRPKVPFESLKQAADLRESWGIVIPVASVGHLIGLKTGTGRALDEEDIRELRKIHGDGA